MTPPFAKYRNALIFGLVVLELYVVGVLALQFSMPEYRDYVAAFALPFDLMVFIPALFYVFVVRKHRLSPLLVLPAIWLGSLVVIQVAQPQNLAFISLLMAATFVIELAIAVREAIRFARIFRTARRQSSDPECWFAPVFYEITRSRRAAKLMGLELATMYYAFFSWRSKPSVPGGAEAFGYHKESGYAAVMGVMLGISLIEIVAVHLLVAQWSLEAALVLTVLSAYFVFWIVGEMRATTLRPILVDGQAVSVNSGIRYSFTIPLDAIGSLGTAEPAAPKQETLNLGMMGSANCWILLKEGVEVETMFGGRRRVKAVGLLLDKPDDFRRLLSEKIASQQ